MIGLLVATSILLYVYKCCCVSVAAVELRGTSMLTNELRRTSFVDARGIQPLIINKSDESPYMHILDSSSLLSPTTTSGVQHDQLMNQQQQQQHLQCFAPDNQGIHRVTSDWYLTEIQDPKYFYPYNELSDFLEGSALLTEDNDDSMQHQQQHLTEAACKFRNIQHSQQFPHA
jgi:hypothetical protein